MTFKILLLSLLSFSTLAAPLKIVATVPEIAWLVKQIGQDQVTVKELNSGDVDLHFLEARIDYILKLRGADAICYSGLGLEEGWLPKVIQRSGNPKLMPGQVGDCNLGRKVNILNKPKGIVDRSMGHIHPQGNPHYTSDPIAMIKAGEVVFEKLSALKPSSKDLFTKNHHKLKTRLTDLHREISNMLSEIKNRKVLSYHSEFNYWINSYKFENQGMLEDKPGMPPSAGRLAEVAASAKKNGVGILLYTDFNNHDLVEKFQDLSKVKVIKLPAHAKTSDDDGYKKWQINMAKRLLREFNFKF